MRSTFSVHHILLDLYIFIKFVKNTSYEALHSPLWDLWPDITYHLKVFVLYLSGALSDERSGLSFGSLSLV